MTETGMLLSNPVHGERRPGTVGQPLPGIEARIVPQVWPEGAWPSPPLPSVSCLQARAASKPEHASAPEHCRRSENAVSEACIGQERSDIESCCVMAASLRPR